MRVSVDLARCQGYANCLSAAPDVFDLDDASGLALVVVADPPSALHESVRHAARMCPVAAIHVEDDGG